MTARVWSAQTTHAQADDYVEHLRTQVLPRARAVDGYLGTRLLRRATPGAVEIVVTFWGWSLEAPDPEGCRAPS